MSATLNASFYISIIISINIVHTVPYFRDSFMRMIELYGQIAGVNYRSSQTSAVEEGINGGFSLVKLSQESWYLMT